MYSRGSSTLVSPCRTGHVLLQRTKGITNFMKSLIAMALCTFACAPLWAGDITDNTSSSNPLNATGDVYPEPTAALSGVQVAFTLSNGTTTYATFGLTGQAANFDAVVSAPEPNTRGTWTIQNIEDNGSSPTLVSVAFTGTTAAGGTGFYPTSTCSPSSTYDCPIDATANFSSPIEINGVMPEYPGYSDLTLDLEDGGLVSNDQMTFYLSSEYVDGPITPATVSSATPEPASLLLMLGGLCCVGGALRFRKG